MPKIKPCPWCKKERKIVFSFPYNEHETIVDYYCDNCNITDIGQTISNRSVEQSYIGE